MSKNKNSTRCAFPARELRNFLSSLVAEVTHFEKSGVADWPVRAYCEQILHLHQLRLAHEDLNHCRCWYEPARQEEAHQ